MPVFAGKDLRGLRPLSFRGRSSMHDIKAIRDNPQAFDAALKRRGLEPLSSSLLAIDEKRRAAITGVGAGAGAPQRGIEGNRRSQEGEGRGAARSADGGGRRAQDHACRRWKRRRKRQTKNCDKELAQIPNLPLDEVPDGADEHGNVRHHVFGEKRDYAFKPKPHVRSRRSARRHGFRGGGETIRRALRGVEERAWRGWNARSGNSSSTFIPASTATPRSIRRCWCATRRCSERRSCRSFKKINLQLRSET